MITPKEAELQIQSQLLDLGTEEVPLSDSLGRVLARPFVADRHGPPFHRVAMDGIAISSARFLAGQRLFPCDDIQAAGDPQKLLKHEEHSLEAMTGAVLPQGCDAVIPFEKIQEEWLAIHPKDGGVWKSALKGDEQHQHSQTNQHGDAQQKVYRVMAEDIKVKPFLNVHRCGEDFSKGDIVMSAPCRMSSPRLAIGASLGYAKVEVYKIPKISLVTTGSELVDIETVPLPHQIRKSNVHAGAAALEACGFSDLEMMHLPDDEQSTREGLSRCLEHRDVLIISGGVSKGKLDYVPSALEAEGVKKVFHRIAQKPGKPLWFGRKGNKLVFGLPGNPASMLVCLHRYVLPLLWKSQGLETPVLEYFSRDELPVKSKLTMFKTVALGNDGHGSAVSLCKDHGSGDYASLGQGDGFVEIPPRDEPWPKGTVFRYYPWH